MKEFTSSGGSTQNCLVIIAANKSDLANVDVTDTKIWAQSRGFKFVESSAATADGVNGINLKIKMQYCPYILWFSSIRTISYCQYGKK